MKKRVMHQHLVTFKWLQQQLCRDSICLRWNLSGQRLP